MAVTRFSAGNYVTVPHRDRPFDRCLGFVCPDDMVVLVSEENRQPQRSGFEIPVLLLGNLHLIWASQWEMDFADGAKPDQKVLEKMEIGERAAYNEVFRPGGPFPGAKYWRMILSGGETIPYDSNSSVCIVKEQTRSQKRKPRSLVPEANLLQAKKAKVENLLPSSESDKAGNKRPLLIPVSNELAVPKQSGTSKKKGTREDFFLPQSPTHSSQTRAPDETKVDRTLVRFFIGKDPDKPLLIPYELVKRFQCFREVLIDEPGKGWCIRRRAYETINPKDFDVAAEFMWDEEMDFNPRFKKNKEDGEDDQFIDDMVDVETRNSAIERCVQAWTIASELVLVELLELVGRKLTALKLDHEEVLGISQQIFREESTGSDEDESVRRDLAMRIAQDIFTNSDQVSILVGNWSRLPDLEIAVLKARLKALGVPDPEETDDEQEDAE